MVILADDAGDALNLSLVQYNFSRGEHSVKVAPHGNAQHGKPYVRSMPSVMCKLKEEAKGNTPKRALQFVSNEAGGIMDATSAGALPRNRQQVKDMRRQITSNQDFDPLYSVMHMCKEGEGASKNPFVRMVNAAPYPMMLIATDYSLDDLVRFCTSSKNFSILGVDPTFSLGNFDVTVTTYRHLLLRPQGNVTGSSPVMFGPMLIHVRKDFATYHYFSSSLVGQRSKLSSLLAFGTDGELALENALAASFPSAQHLRCFLHFRQNVDRKLRELNIPKHVALEIAKDIMGCPTQLQHGLVDAENETVMDRVLARFEKRWNELEKPYNSPPFFYHWFMKHCRNNVAKYMLQNVRTKAGLGSPPSPYYTNEVESKNRVLKEAVQYKSSQLPDFIEKMKALMEEQRHEIERAVIDGGEYRLREEYKNLAVSPTKWYKLTAEQRRRKIERFMKATVRDISDEQSSPDCPLDSLAVPQHLKESIWKKAQDLVEDEAAIVKAPGEECAWCVKSYSNKRPHYVRKSKCGGFLCDEQCLSYKSLKLCSHTVALAIKMECMDRFTKWHSTIKYKPNVTALVETGKPSSAGKKSARRGVSKKNAKEIKQSIAYAEDAGLKWKTRGAEDSGSSEEDSTASEPLLSSSEPSSSHLRQECDIPAASPVLSSATAVITSPRDVRICSVVGSPPPLIPATLVYSPSPRPFQQQERCFVETPFWLTFICGNISRCNGCKGKISRDANKKVLPPPDDIVLGHKEYVLFQNPKSGMFEQSREKRNVYYHPWVTCVAPHFRDFDPGHHITVADAVKLKLLPQHRECLAREFGIALSL